MQIIHLVARAMSSKRPFEDPEAAAWTWDHLRAAFPRVLTVSLMPGHPHLLAPVEDPERARLRLSRLLGRFSCKFARGARFWEPVPPPKIVSGRYPILREIRYIDRNALDAGLVDDAIEWPWTTLRDVVGACVDPWVRPIDLAPVLECDVRDVPARLHRYVTRDRSGRDEGTALPRPAPSTAISMVPLAALEIAVAAALRIPRDSVRRSIRARRLFVALARDQGWDHGPALAAMLGVSRTTIHRAPPVPAEDLTAARLCLGDPRLTRRMAWEIDDWARAAVAGLQPRRPSRSGRAA